MNYGKRAGFRGSSMKFYYFNFINLYLKIPYDFEVIQHSSVLSQVFYEMKIALNISWKHPFIKLIYSEKTWTLEIPCSLRNNYIFKNT